MSLVRNQHSGEQPESDMTPMVDVTFLLLIFFMVTAAFALQRSIAIPNPQLAAGRDADSETPDIIVEVDRFNTFHVMTDNWEQEAPSVHDLILTLRQARESGASGKPLNRMLVKADPDSLHEKVVAALDSGAYVGIPEIALSTLE